MTVALACVDDTGPTGFADLTLAAVAARAGVAVPSLYKHVEGLPGLRREVALACVEEFTAVLVAATDAAPTGHTGARLRAAVVATRAWARRHPGRYAAVQGGWPQDDQAVAVQAAAARAVEVLAAAVADLGVPPHRHVDAVRAVRAALHGFVVLELDGGFGMPDDVDTSFTFLVDGLVAGLTRTATP
ncbi:TetR-like C-terminal domain-containing protein [Cellulomonas fimi]|uniref:TetR-like C-terminal domain-containing protein n=1 Tax=Cellulomonas fimi TaxID=1708 RepID=UPI0002D3A3E2|nr:TetR-like C-terminal domain-containing protein [Cellulomonas fimi]